MTDIREKIKAKIEREAIIYYRETIGEEPEGWEDEIMIHKIAANIWAVRCMKLVEALMIIENWARTLPPGYGKTSEVSKNALEAFEKELDACLQSKTLGAWMVED